MSAKDVFELARTDRRNLCDLPRLRASIAAGGFDAVVAVWPVNVTYSGGAYISFADLLSFAVTTTDGVQGVVINEADAYYFREYSWVKDVRSYRFTSTIFEINDSAVDVLASMLADLDLASSRVGIELGYLPQRYFGASGRTSPPHHLG